MNRLGITGIIRKIVKLNAFSQKIRQLDVKIEKIAEIEKEPHTKTARYAQLINGGTTQHQTKIGKNIGQVTGQFFMKQVRDNAMQNISRIFDE
ncbi:MAG: hypothetical protein LBK06_07220 [Planctomycetaceae bacterium]|jgi:hypothetical protein|nr:hypothetical protein [Planctomycetaceae bacterium]